MKKIKILPDKELEKYKNALFDLLSRNNNGYHFVYIRGKIGMASKTSEIVKKHDSKTKAKINKKIDEWNKEMTPQIEKAKKIQSLQSRYLSKIGDNKNLNKIYHSIINKGVKIEDKNILKLENYITDLISNYVEKYIKTQNYFREKPIKPSSDKLIKLCLNENIYGNILLGKKFKAKKDAKNIFKKINKKLESEKKSCQEIKSIFTFLNPPYNQLAKDKNYIIELHKLTEKNNISIKQIRNVLDAINQFKIKPKTEVDEELQKEEESSIHDEKTPLQIKLETLQASEIKPFITTSILRASLKKDSKSRYTNKINKLEIKRIEAEIHAKNIFLENEKFFQEKIKDAKEKYKNNQTNIDSFFNTYEDRVYLGEDNSKKTLIGKIANEQIRDSSGKIIIKIGEKITPELAYKIINIKPQKEYIKVKDFIVSTQKYKDIKPESMRKIAISEYNMARHKETITKYNYYAALNQARYTIAINHIQENSQTADLRQIKKVNSVIIDTKYKKNSYENIEWAFKETTKTFNENTDYIKKHTGVFSNIERLKSEWNSAWTEKNTKKHTKNKEERIKSKHAYRKF